MASAARCLSRSSLLYTRRIPSRRKPQCPILQHRPLTSTPFRRNPSDSSKQRDSLDSTTTDPDLPARGYHMTPEEEEQYRLLSPADRAKHDEAGRAAHAFWTSSEMEALMRPEIARAVKDTEAEFPFRRLPPVRSRGYWMEAEEDDPDMNVEDDDEWNDDDISSYAHGDLEQHREAREYARLAAWELPLLSKLAKPFTPPALTTPLRFRYTTYMGEHHPAERKIVVEFCTADLLTNPTHRSKLIKLLGPRYNPSNDLAKLSCEKFETQAQNKRYLGDLVNTLLKEAEDETDTFADVPFDFRHHKERSVPVFPKGWVLTEKRKWDLRLKREEKRMAEEGRRREGVFVDGLGLIEESRRVLVEGQRERDRETVTVEHRGVGTGDNGGAGSGRGRKPMGR